VADLGDSGDHPDILYSSGTDVYKWVHKTDL
jgi:hypothetical protein